MRSGGGLDSVANGHGNCIPKRWSGCAIRPVRSTYGRCWGDVRWRTMRGPKHRHNAGCDNEESAMVEPRRLPAVTRAQEADFVGQCSFQALWPHLPLR